MSAKDILPATRARIGTLRAKLRHADTPEDALPDALAFNPRQQRALIIAVIIALFVGFLLVRGFFTVVALALIAGVIFYPMYTAFTRRLKPGTSAMLVFIIMLVLLIIPIVITLVITVGEVRHLIENLTRFASSDSSSPVTLAEAGNQLLRLVNNVLGTVTGGAYQITLEQLQDYLAQAAAALASFFLNALTSSFAGIAVLVTQFIIFLYVFTSVLTNADKLREAFRNLNPLGDGVSSLYLSRAGQMTRGVVAGQFMIAACQGIAEAAILYVAGIDYFFFMAFLLTFLSIIPLGGGIVAIPLGIIMLALGNIWQGVVILAGHFVIITNIDNVLRPRLVPKTVRMNSALMMLAVFGGLGLFGFLGIAIGPIVMILVLTTIQVYVPLAQANKAAQGVQPATATAGKQRKGTK